jgi:predicted metalloprotease
VKWTPGSRRDDIEDRRGIRVSKGAAIGGGSAILVVIVALVSQALGVDLGGLFGGGGGGGGGGAQPAAQDTRVAGAASGSSGLDPAHDPDVKLVDFVTFVINDIQDTFTKQLAEQRPYGHADYQKAKLVVFTEAVNSGCGQSSSAVGPFYCPPDGKAYIDLSFYRDLNQRFGAPGDFAQAYVLAHELGHHLQNLFGIDDDVRRKTTRANQNDLSVRQELQADCFAGVWASSANQRALLEMGDAKEALDAATAIGDDRLQKMAGRQVNQETWTHGSSEQRVRWFTKGFESGRFAVCDTFSAPRL